MIICFVLIYMLITLKGHTFSFSLWQENTEDIIYITWWAFCHLCAKLMIGNGSPVQDGTMGRLYITGYRQALTWSPIIQVSLAVLVSTEEPSKTCLLLKKHLSSLHKNTTNLQHFTYTFASQHSAVVWREKTISGLCSLNVKRCFNKHGMHSEPRRCRTHCSFPIFHLTWDSER